MEMKRTRADLVKEMWERFPKEHQIAERKLMLDTYLFLKGITSDDRIDARAIQERIKADEAT